MLRFENALKIVKRFEIPGFSVGLYSMTPLESVTALLIFLRIVAGSSNILMYSLTFASDLLIFFVGVCKLITRAPAFGINGSGIFNNSLPFP